MDTIEKNGDGNILFEKLANGITKHYKKIIIVWILALLISIPAILNVDSVVQYSQTEGGSTDYESVEASDIINNNFQSSVANGTIIVVLQSDDVTDAQMRDFVLALQENILESSELKYLLNVTSTYTVEELMLSSYIAQLGPAMHYAEAMDPGSFDLSAFGSSVGITNVTFLQQIYDLGAYDDATVSVLTQSILENGTLSTYPVQLPSSLMSSFVAPNNGTMLFMVTFSVEASYAEDDGDKPMLDNVGTIRDIISDVESDTGYDIRTYVTGDAAISADMENSSTEDTKIIEPLTILIIIVLMSILFRSLLAEFLPLGVVAIALGLSQAVVFVIGSIVADVQYTVLSMLFSVLMGVGTDYSIFIMTRYREERIKGATREQAVHSSVTWAGESILTSGATVIIAFFAMATASYSMMQTMGLILGLAIVVALLIALTLVPALLMLVGNRIFWPTSGERWAAFASHFMHKRDNGKRNYFHRAAKFSVKHAKIIMVAAILVTVPCAYLYTTVETSYDFIGSMGDCESTDGMAAMSEDFGAGTIMPTQIVMQSDIAIYDGTTLNMEYMDAVENITATIAANSEVYKVIGPTRPYGEIVDYHNFTSLPSETQQAILEDIGSNNMTVLITATLADEPMSASSVDLVPTLRDDLGEAKDGMPVLSGTDILVGGSTAIIYDMSNDMNSQFGFIEILVVIGIFAVLLLVLGSVLLPAFAVVSIWMSICWSFAATYLIFDVWLGVPLLFMIPLILFVMLMGIGMDYNVFILTRIREEAHKGKNTEDSVVDAVDWTGGIITALALIMGGAFGSMMLSGNSMLQEFGFALAFAVLMDAMVVRTYIVPAAMALMGDKAWWAPGKLQRVGRKKKGENGEAPKN